MTEDDRASRARAQWDREVPGLNLVPMETLGRLSEVTQTLRKNYFEPVFKAHGLKPGEFDVLATLRRSGAPYTLTPTELYSSTMITSGGMTARLDRLEKAGFIARKPHETDRRALSIVLTDAGMSLIETLLPEHIATQERALKGLTPEEQRTLGALLHKVLAGID